MYAPIVTAPARRVDVVELAARGAAIALAAVASYIHFTLGSLLYTLNGVAFAALAAGLVVPFALVIGPRYGRALRTLVRLGLIGLSVATIGGWLLIGARITLGYEAVATEGLIALLMAIDISRSTGGPVAVVTELLGVLPGRLS